MQVRHWPHVGLASNAVVRRDLEDPRREDPSEVSVPEAGIAIVRVVFRIRVLVVDRVGQCPAEDRALVRKGVKDKQQQLHGGRHLVRAMRPQAMCTGRNAETTDRPQRCGKKAGLPFHLPTEAEHQAPDCEHMLGKNANRLYQSTVDAKSEHALTDRHQGLKSSHQRRPPSLLRVRVYRVGWWRWRPILGVALRLGRRGLHEESAALARRAPA